VNKSNKKVSKKKEVKRIVEDYVFLPDLSIKGGGRKVQKLAKEFYFQKWRGKEKHSPAFNNEIIKATRRGFSHLVGKKIVTNYKDALKRLRHLPNAKQILETTTEVYETRITVDKRNNKVNQYSLLGKLENGLVLKVIVHESVKSKDKTFLSIFDVARIKKG